MLGFEVWQKEKQVQERKDSVILKMQWILLIQAWN